MSRSAAFSRFIGASVLALLLLHQQASAVPNICDGTILICQVVSVEHQAPGGPALDTDSIGGMSETDINADILASFGIPNSSLFGIAAAGRFGNVGLRGAYGRPGDANMALQVLVESALFTNLLGFTQHVRADFVIDGGTMQMLAGIGSTLGYRLSLDAFVYDETGQLQSTPSFLSEGALTQTGNFAWTFFATGEDIGAAVNPSKARQVDIPLSLQSFDIGDVLPGWTVGISYFFSFEASFVDFSEALHAARARSEDTEHIGQSAGFASTSTKATRQYSPERLLQAWLVPRWIKTSPVFISRSPSSRIA
jgi:hypothetical protein